MRQIVFLKQVPANTEIRLDPETHTLVRSGAKACTNPDDLHALRMAVEIQSRIGGQIVAVTMGPPQAEAVSYEALMYGADEAVLVTGRAFAGSDTWSTAYILSAVVRKIGDASVLLFGRQAIDGDTAQVGPGVAARLDYPQLTGVTRIEEVSSRSITVEKICDMGTQVLRSSFPCTLTVMKESNRLPIPSLCDWERSQQKKLIRWTASDLEIDLSCVGLEGSPTRVVNTYLPERQTSVRWLKDVSELSSLLLVNISKE